MVRSGLVGLFILVLFTCAVRAENLDDLKKDVENLRKELAKRGDNRASGKVDQIAANKYGPNAEVTTKNGKLQIGGLLQVWYQSVENDNEGYVFDPADLTRGNNETFDNDTFRIRRTELNFYVDIHENVSAYVMIDPARRHNIQFLPMPTLPFYNEPFDNAPALQGGGSLFLPYTLQDAYINFHGIVPHHDFTIGQFKPPSGEEAWRNSGQLEFVERTMIANTNNIRDIGVMVHGGWLEKTAGNASTGRVQYWFGLFNGQEVITDPEVFEGANRSDQNDEKDFAWRVAVQPVWNAEKWYGRLELGYTRTDGLRGESGHATDTAQTINGLNIQQTWINRQGAWAWYRPGGPVKGWWLRGEWASFRDRLVRQPTFALALGGETDRFGNTVQANPKPVVASGWTFSTGYKVSDSIFADSCSGWASWLKNTEFAFRYEVYSNVFEEDLNRPDRETDLFKTQVYTAGINYYIKGHNCKVQANYNWVDEASDGNPNRGVQEIKNNAFVLNFQVMF